MELYNPAMGILLLAVLLASGMILVTAAAFSLRGDEQRAWKIVKAWGGGVAVYAAIWLVVAMLPRISVMKTALPYCDDDLCMTVLNVARTPADGGFREHFEVRLSSRANHGSRNAKGAEVYLTDNRNRKLRLVDAAPIPFDADVDPGKSVDTTLSFDVPSDAQKLYFEVRMAGISYASLMIGSGQTPWKPLLKLAVE